MTILGLKSTGTSVANLRTRQGKYAEAEPLLRRALEILEKALGEDHPNTIMARTNLDTLLANMSAILILSKEGKKR